MKMMKPQSKKKVLFVSSRLVGLDYKEGKLSFVGNTVVLSEHRFPQERGSRFWAGYKHWAKVCRSRLFREPDISGGDGRGNEGSQSCCLKNPSEEGVKAWLTSLFQFSSAKHLTLDSSHTLWPLVCFLYHILKSFSGWSLDPAYRLMTSIDMVDGKMEGLFTRGGSLAQHGCLDKASRKKRHGDKAMSIQTATLRSCPVSTHPVIHLHLSSQNTFIKEFFYCHQMKMHLSTTYFSCTIQCEFMLLKSPAPKVFFILGLYRIFLFFFISDRKKTHAHTYKHIH